MTDDITRGDIAYVSSADTPSIGCEIWSDRPAIVVSGDPINHGTGCVMVVYLSTSRTKAASPTQVRIMSSGKPALAICSQVHSVDRSRIGRVIGHATDKEMRAVSQALTGALALGDEHFTTLFRKWDNYVKTYHLDITEELEDLARAPRDKCVEKLRLELAITAKERDAYRALAEAKQAQLDNLHAPDTRKEVLPCP